MKGALSTWAQRGGGSTSEEEDLTLKLMSLQLPSGLGLKQLTEKDKHTDPPHRSFISSGQTEDLRPVSYLVFVSCVGLAWCSSEQKGKAPRCKRQ
ncbi:unnamed protein product [Pleuronectes platessa]|uniref:Uncharacterized protein n=1 Tax=Pleuronectes platessa TaxID=8262 RepID=A0A9N7Y5D9_PLEPL|nr:unnamed protein product [Pleuronectes platessa]